MRILVDGLEVNLKVGADPEIFVSDGTRLVSAHGLIPGTKESPHPVKDGAIQVDGMALEFNIDPADSMEQFVSYMNSVMGQLRSRLPKQMKLSPVATAHFGAEYIASQPTIAKELGCSPDFNAYTGQANQKPNVNAPFRTAAGHIHIGWTESANIEDYEHLNICCEFTKVLDVYLGLPSVLLDPDTERRQLYGAPGAFRPKSYGVEYRVLSNFWLQSDKMMQYVYKQTELAMRKFMGGFRVTEDSVVKAINSSDKKLAKALMNSYEVPAYV